MLLFLQEPSNYNVGEKLYPTWLSAHLLMEPTMRWREQRPRRPSRPEVTATATPNSDGFPWLLYVPHIIVDSRDKDQQIWREMRTGHLW